MEGEIRGQLLARSGNRAFPSLFTTVLRLISYRTNRAVSPADSLGSTSAFTSSRPVLEPRTARQLAAARNKQTQRDDDDSDGSEAPKGGIGMQITPSTDSLALGANPYYPSGYSNPAAKSANGTPTLASGQLASKDGGRSRNRSGGGSKRSKMDEDDEGESEMDDEDDRPRKSTGAVLNSGGIGGKADGEGEMGEGDGDGAVYCVCRQVGYGEMIGCDEEDCEIEWVSHWSGFGVIV